MFRHISQIIYFLLASILVGLLILTSFFWQENFVLSNNIAYLYALLLLPIFVYIYDLTITDTKNIFMKSYIPKYIGVIVLAILLYMFDISSTTLFFVVFFLFSILFPIDTRVSFFAALVLFVFVMFYIITGNTQMAEDLSIYAYYFLIMGVLLEILSHTLLPKVLKTWNN